MLVISITCQLYITDYMHSDIRHINLAVAHTTVFSIRIDNPNTSILISALFISMIYWFSMVMDLRFNSSQEIYLDSKVHGTNMGPIWVLSASDGPHVGPMNLAISLWKCKSNALRHSSSSSGVSIKLRNLLHCSHIF